MPIDFPLTNGGEAFWLDDRTIAHAVAEGSDKNKVISLYAISVKVETSGGLKLPDSPALIGKFPTDTVTNFRYSAKAGVLVFSDLVHPDGDLKKAKENDKSWENRGDSAYVYDETFDRHWDTWVGPKRPSLFSVQLAKGADGKWALGTDFINLLKGTGHVCTAPALNCSLGLTIFVSIHPSNPLVAQTTSTCLTHRSSTPPRTLNFPRHGTLSRT